MRAACGGLPAASGAWGALSEPSAASDESTIQVVGLGFTGVLRWLNALVAAPFHLLPLGTHASRAAMASAFVIGLVGVLAFDVARTLAHGVTARFWPSVDEPGSSRGKLLAAIAAVAVLTALLGPAFQAAAEAPGGATTGALLVTGALWSTSGRPTVARLRGSALLFGLSIGYEPVVALLVGVTLAATTALDTGWRRFVKDAVRAEAFALGLLALIGLSPLVVGLLTSRRDVFLSLPVAPLHGALGVGPRAFGSWSDVRSFFGGTMGTVASVLALAGALAVLAAGARRSRALPLLSVAIVSLGAMAVARAPVGQAATPTLCAILLLHVLATASLQAIVLFVANTRVPFAEASAAMVVVLELALPARAADESATRRDARHPLASVAWMDTAFATAPVASVLLIAQPDLYRRIVAARVTKTMRPDLLVLPTFDVRSPAGLSALAREPKLTALVRDLALGASPEELSFAELASVRPVLATFDPRWDRTLARHLVPLGLSSRFELEPRGITDRRAALDAFRPVKERLIQTIAGKTPDVALTALTAGELRARALAMAACGERELLSRALDDLRPFAPEDPVANTLVRRIVTTKGPIEIRDLAP